MLQSGITYRRCSTLYLDIQWGVTPPLGTNDLDVIQPRGVTHLIDTGNDILFFTQLNGTNTTYLDVCPLLEPSSSTPTGDYVQPVDVARDIELQTRNLPAPVSFNFWHSSHVRYMFHLAMQISGFSYICSLGGTVNLPTVYNNESSLTCVVNQNQVIYSRYDLIII